jgi:hypothetical protein
MSEKERKKLEIEDKKYVEEHKAEIDEQWFWKLFKYKSSLELVESITIFCNSILVKSIIP